MSEASDQRRAVLLPGRMFGPHAPLLMYAGDAARARGARVRPFEWPPDIPGYPSTEPAGVAAWVRDRVAPVLDEEGTGGATPLLVGKSLGTFAAPLAAERRLPAVWLTPLLCEPLIVAALRRAEAPFLLIGGTADRHTWDGRVARSLGPHVLEVAEADHGMHVPGSLAASATVLGLVVTAIERFLDDVVWPGRPHSD
jgi:hypothetical protein